MNDTPHWVSLNPGRPIRRPALVAALALVASGALHAANIAPLGTAILGVNDAIDSDAGTPRFNSGVGANINDEDVGTRVDNWFGAAPTDQGQSVSFVGIVWPGVRHDQIDTVTLTMATFTDGGWFGTPSMGPVAGDWLTEEYLVEPTVQVTTDGGTTWTTVPHTSDYLPVFLNHSIGGGGNPNPSFATATFSLSTPATLVNGVRIIGSNGGTADGNGFIGVFELEVYSSPTADTDGDGLPDSWEEVHGFPVGPNDAAGDPDSDGLTNLEEYQAGTDPRKADTDEDGLNDGPEVKTHFTNPLSADTDGDGLTDGAEVNTHHTDPLLADTDGDGLSDGAEINVHHTNPLLEDTDGDGHSDSLEINQGSDPNDPESRPDNWALTGTAFIGVKESLESGPETEEPYEHVGSALNINDGDPTTRVDTWNGDQAHVAFTVSYVGVTWDQPLPAAQPVARVELVFATFFDGGWFGVNGIDPGAGGALTATHLAEPTVEISNDGGATWTAVPHTSDYVSRLTGHNIGGGGFPNPSTVSATFTLNTPAVGITGVRLIGTDGGAASGGFLGVFELRVRPASSDSDNDGMDDEWERLNGLNVGVNDAAEDPDQDGLTNLQEFTRGTNPQVADTDGDGLNDGAEVNTHQTNPLQADTDEDGLSDGAEVNTHHTDPLKADTDGDGFNDGLEIAQGTDPLSASSAPANVASLGVGILGTREALDSGDDVPWANAGSVNAINDFNLTSRVDTFNGANLGTYSYVGIRWDQPQTNPIVRLELTLAIFFDGGWFGVNFEGPGSGGQLSPEYLVEPIVQVIPAGGTEWATVAYTSDYLTALNGHGLPGVDFGAPTTVTATFTPTEPAVNIEAIRIIGTEGGTASGGFLGVFELGVYREATVVPPPFEIIGLLPPGQPFQIEFPTEAGVTYTVEYKDALSAATWTTLTTVTGDGTTKTASDPNQGDARFYRVTHP